MGSRLGHVPPTRWTRDQLDEDSRASGWIEDLGQLQIVPVGVLSGVFSLDNLEVAQGRGLTLYWAHRLTDLTAWIENTRPSIAS